MTEATNNIRRVDLTPAPYRREVVKQVMELLKPDNPDTEIQDLQAVAEMVLGVLIASVVNAMQDDDLDDIGIAMNLSKTLGLLEAAASIVEDLPFIHEPAREVDD